MGNETLTKYANQFIINFETNLRGLLSVIDDRTLGSYEDCAAEIKILILKTTKDCFSEYQISQQIEDRKAKDLNYVK